MLPKHAHIQEAPIDSFMDSHSSVNFNLSKVSVEQEDTLKMKSYKISLLNISSFWLLDFMLVKTQMKF